MNIPHENLTREPSGRFRREEDGDRRDVRWPADTAQRRGSKVLRCELGLEQPHCFRPMPPTVAEHLLSVAQEALTNVLRHADATRVRIELAFGEKTLRLLVSDDGQGFDAFGKPAGFGLKGIHERAAKIGGQVDVASILGKGTQIIIMVALPPGVVK